jgi:hypothetical protein
LNYSGKYKLFYKSLQSNFGDNRKHNNSRCLSICIVRSIHRWEWLSGNECPRDHDRRIQDIAFLTIEKDLINTEKIQDKAF